MENKELKMIVIMAFRYYVINLSISRMLYYVDDGV